MIPRPCNGCGALTRSQPCTRCRRHRDRATDRGKRQRRPFTNTERQRRAQAVAAHRATYGDWCPGIPALNRPVHRSTDLTADHVQAVGAGGTEDGPLVVRCRSCNSAKAARFSG
jgi:5-methylcytosine-specific restriction enzyme A